MFDIATAKTRLSITDATQDALLNTAMNACLGFAENYCDRKFMYALEKVDFQHVGNSTLQFRRFPVERLITVTPSYLQYQVHALTGVMEFHNPTVEEKMSVTYTGGYKTLPDDLEMALWLMFDGLWPTFTQAGSSVAIGAIKNIKVESVGSVTYETGGSASSGGGAGGGLFPPSAFLILDFYRLNQC